GGQCNGQPIIIGNKATGPGDKGLDDPIADRDGVPVPDFLPGLVVAGIVNQDKTRRGGLRPKGKSDGIQGGTVRKGIDHRVQDQFPDPQGGNLLRQGGIVDIIEPNDHQGGVPLHTDVVLFTGGDIDQ